MKGLLGILCVASVLNFQCKKSPPGGPVFTGRLIVNGPCDHYAIQLIRGSLDTARVEAVWHDPDNDSTYTQAFSVFNYCTFGSLGLARGDTFTFQLDPHPLAQTCPICQIAVAVPTKQNAVINVQKIK
ncbi:MAG TPA: hypothetical protein VG870_02390 [Chitinophagaceae bacterium]|nr:hypothetical protein [Chitinophagaceae bacterium]